MKPAAELFDIYSPLACLNIRCERFVIGEDIKDVEFSWPIGMPLVRPIGRELWEVRSSLLHGRIARVIFYVERECMVLLHGFIKKTEKTPQHEIDLALKRERGRERP